MIAMVAYRNTSRALGGKLLRPGPLSVPYLLWARSRRFYEAALKKFAVSAYSEKAVVTAADASPLQTWSSNADTGALTGPPSLRSFCHLLLEWLAVGEAVAWNEI